MDPAANDIQSAKIFPNLRTKTLFPHVRRLTPTPPRIPNTADHARHPIRAHPRLNALLRTPTYPKCYPQKFREFPQTPNFRSPNGPGIVTSCLDTLRTLDED